MYCVRIDTGRGAYEVVHVFIQVLMCVCSIRVFHVFTTDHKVHYYDLRDLRSPLCVLEGHKKAVSYCQFVNHRELVSL